MSFIGTACLAGSFDPSRHATVITVSGAAKMLLRSNLRSNPAYFREESYFGLCKGPNKTGPCVCGDAEAKRVNPDAKWRSSLPQSFEMQKIHEIASHARKVTPNRNNRQFEWTKG
jgi:hypothetical protein